MVPLCSCIQGTCSPMRFRGAQMQRQLLYCPPNIPRPSKTSKQTTERERERESNLEEASIHKLEANRQQHRYSVSIPPPPDLALLSRPPGPSLALNRIAIPYCSSVPLQRHDSSTIATRTLNSQDFPRPNRPILHCIPCTIDIEYFAQPLGLGTPQHRLMSIIPDSAFALASTVSFN